MIPISCRNPEAVVQEAFWLAWQACGGPLGMGVFQDRPGVTKEDVLRNIARRGDYPGLAKMEAEGRVFPANKPGEMYADYVFGRMMKLGLRWNETAVLVDEDHNPRPDYQGWSRTYPTYEALVREALKNVEG
jgi:hypothetical protein